MIIDTTVKIKWNAKNVKRLSDLGYIYTKINDDIEVKIQDLSKGSNALIHIKCDYCGQIFTRTYNTYMRLSEKDIIHKDCCNDIKCTTLKAQETIMAKYNVSNVRELDWVNEKISQTNLIKYGCENPFGNEEIKNKLKNTNLEKYGYTSYSKTQAFKENNSQKMKDFFEQHPEKILIKEKSPRWIGDADYKRNERTTFEYNNWRKQVYKRDNYTCQCCKMKRISNNQPSLNAHHIENFASNLSKRTDIDNGITLCEICHAKFHKIYGKQNNTLSQLQEFIQNFNNLDEKIC